MSPRESKTGPDGPVPTEEIETTRKALVALKRKPLEVANEVRLKCIPLVGFRTPDGFYLIPEFKIARTMRVSEKTANRFLRLGQDYKRARNLRVPAAALETGRSIIEFVKDLLEVRFKGELVRFPDRREIDRFMKEAAIFEKYLRSVTEHPLLPLGDFTGAESGVLVLGLGEEAGVGPLKWGGIFREATFDHNRAVVFRSPVETVSCPSVGSIEPLFGYFGVESQGEPILCEFLVLDQFNARLFRQCVSVGREGARISPVIFQVPTMFIGASKAVRLQLTVGGVQCWKESLRLAPFEYFDIEKHLHIRKMPKWWWAIEAKIYRWQMMALVAISRGLLNALLNLRVMSKSYLRAKWRIMRRALSPGPPRSNSGLVREPSL